eukprot:10794981-Karenia_brevis.AAC.1
MASTDTNAVLRDRSRSRSLRGEGNDIIINRATFCHFSTTFLQQFYRISTIVLPLKSFLQLFYHFSTTVLPSFYYFSTTVLQLVYHVPT